MFIDTSCFAFISFLNLFYQWYFLFFIIHDFIIGFLVNKTFRQRILIFYRPHWNSCINPCSFIIIPDITFCFPFKNKLIIFQICVRYIYYTGNSFISNWYFFYLSESRRRTFKYNFNSILNNISINIFVFVETKIEKLCVDCCNSFRYFYFIHIRNHYLMFRSNCSNRVSIVVIFNFFRYYQIPTRRII